uniref:RING-type domain-containing protein n=1 Tax=viral metagenome TaxID=1070528 RepID=A0A6C0CC56_9ZZZZ
MSYFELDENSRTIEQPDGLKITLRKHQLTSIAGMMELENQSTIVVDKPAANSGFCDAIRSSSNHLTYIDNREICNSTYVLETNSAILADKVGSGKTYMIIGLMLAQKKPQEHNKVLIGTNHFSVKLVSTGECNNINLIVVPHNLINQWDEFMGNSSLKYIKLNLISDFDVFCDDDYVDRQFSTHGSYVRFNKVMRKNVPGGKIKTQSGSKSAKVTATYVYRRHMLNKKKMDKLLKNTDTIILNLNRYNTFKKIFKYEKWSRVIIDEMDSIKIPVAFNESGNFNWFLTATPTTLFNISTRHCVVKIFGNNPGLLPYFTVKNKNEYVDKSIVLPQPRLFMIESTTKKIVSVLKDLVPTDVLRLINAGNMNEALNKLNCNVDTEENIVDILTKNIKTDLHNLTKELEYVNSIQIPNKEARISKIESDIGRCKVKLESINEKVNSIKDECCLICADTFKTPAILDCCKNVFCIGCLIAALRTSDDKCPYCRTVVKGNKGYHVIGEKKVIEKNDKVVPPAKNGFTNMEKQDILEIILKYIATNAKTPRILIFSDYHQTFDKIKKNIANAKLKYATISGVPAHITNVINNFNEGTINVLLLDSLHYGSGLNLQAADFVILFHRMRSEVETQVIGRAHRYGRTKPLSIIYLISDTEDKRVDSKSKVVSIKNSDELNMIIVPDVKASAKSDDVVVKSNVVVQNKKVARKKVLIESESESEEEFVRNGPIKKYPKKKSLC